MFNQIEPNLADIIPLFKSTGKKNCTNLARTTNKTNSKKLLSFLKQNPLSIVDFCKNYKLSFCRQTEI